MTQPFSVENEAIRSPRQPSVRKDDGGSLADRLKRLETKLDSFSNDDGAGTSPESLYREIFEFIPREVI